MQEKIKHRFEDALSRKPRGVWASAMSWEDAIGVAPGNHLPGGVRATEKGLLLLVLVVHRYVCHQGTSCKLWLGPAVHPGCQFYSRARNVLCSSQSYCWYPSRLDHPDLQAMPTCSSLSAACLP